MSRPPLPRGANVSLTRENPTLTGVVLGVTWHERAGSGLDDDVVAATMLCDAAGDVLSDEHFVFFNQLVSPDTSVAQRDAAAGGSTGGDTEQIEVDLAAVPAEVERIAVMIYLNEGRRTARNLGQLRTCTIRVLDLATGNELARSEDLAGALTSETALVLGQLYRRAEGWKFRVVGQGYSAGLAGVAADYGMSL